MQCGTTRYGAIIKSLEHFRRRVVARCMRRLVCLVFYEELVNDFGG